MSRKPIAEIISYNKPLLQHEVLREDNGEDLTREALRRKLDALAASAFQFFRGTFHLMSWDLLQNRVPGAKPATPEGLIVGDLHLENFGVYRGQSGELCFDVNDFDDIGVGPLDLDLKRLCTSALLLGARPDERSAARAPGSTSALLPPVLPASVCLKTARVIALAWADEIEKIGGRFPVLAWTEPKADGLVQKLLREHGHKTRDELIARVAPDKGHTSLKDPKKFARPGKGWVQTVKKAFDEYLENLEQLKSPDAPKGWEVHDIAYGFKGTGSLGRLRFLVLVGERDERRLFELKEARPSVMDAARNLPPPRDRGRAQTASIRRLQGDPWARVASTHLGPLSALGREIEPSEEKIGSDRFAMRDKDHEELFSYARQCGQVLARLHCRHSAPVMFDSAWNAPDAANAAVVFAEKYAAQVVADHQAFVQSKSQVAKALGL